MQDLLNPSFAHILCIVSTIVSWFMLFIYRERILKGLEGENGHLEAGEMVMFLIAFCTPPILFYIGLLTDYKLYALGFVAVVTGYALTGRYIFDWAIALRSGASKVTETLKEEVKQQ